MCQQPAITEKLTAGRAHPPAADASAEDTSPAERDPFLDHYFRRIDPRVAASFSPEQRDAIKAMFGARGVARHTVEIRRSLPIGRGRYYLVLQLGRASCRARVCTYVSISVVAVPLKKKK